MEILQQTVRALGVPVWAEPLDDLLGQQALMARWRHTDAHVVIPAADAIRVVFNLAGGPLVRHAEAGEVVSVRSLPANVSVMLPNVPSETMITGQADILQIFIEPELIEQPSSEALEKLPLPLLYIQLKRAVLQLLVAARHSEKRDHIAAKAKLYEIVIPMLRSLAAASQDTPAPNSLGPGGLLRVDRLISRAIERAEPLPLTDMAEEAEWSVAHLVRTFRKQRGTTPHQTVITRRLERSMDLLLLPNLAIADIADAAGFSSPAHFIATFRQRMGVTPGAYQRALGPVIG